MSVIVLTGGPGSPGVTTTSLGLTLCWPGDVMLSDCDRDPAQAIPAGYLRGLDLGGRGLAVLARLHREARGIGPELASWLDGCTAPRVIYSSCNPTSLAQDLTVMPALRPVEGRVFDMFPHTTHVEAALLLERASVAPIARPTPASDRYNWT